MHNISHAHKHHRKCALHICHRPVITLPVVSLSQSRSFSPWSWHNSFFFFFNFNSSCVYFERGLIDARACAQCALVLLIHKSAASRIRLECSRWLRETCSQLFTWRRLRTIKQLLVALCIAGTMWREHWNRTVVMHFLTRTQWNSATQSLSYRPFHFWVRVNLMIYTTFLADLAVCLCVRKCFNFMLETRDKTHASYLIKQIFFLFFFSVLVKNQSVRCHTTEVVKQVIRRPLNEIKYNQKLAGTASTCTLTQARRRWRRRQWNQ